MSSTYSDDDIDSWVEAIDNLHDYTTRDPGDARAAEHAVANLWSGDGYQDAPTHVLRMFVKAIETGYAAALRDVRDGQYDDEIETWRQAEDQGQRGARRSASPGPLVTG
ncbi:hypothetical protein [Couchioplanes azureus]|uniref:hypothetical protein n=1 Tax=Couchioplanes caeruleus TaxID=56438 RepID=UPI00166FFF7D|nr:hypothetical protein [Couchioplanes caeruleus]GGQ88218.1 hypothetical protein GCM10010166_67770 [Couchioplanes caeruleus subsp. azureus]